MYKQQVATQQFGWINFLGGSMNDDGRSGGAYKQRHIVCIWTLRGLHGPPVVWLHGPEKCRLGKAVAAAAALSSSPVNFSCFLFHKYIYTIL
jgi:hypothetical protein